MPKVVDPAARRQAVAEAVFRVIQRDGIARASLRNVATEAGLAIGSIRHYFRSHDELMGFALHALSENVRTRVLRHAEDLLAVDSGVDRRALTVELLAELLPLDERRRRESVVWLAFLTEARTEPRLRRYTHELHETQRALVRRVLLEARRLNRIADWLDIGLETERLCALLDGLTVTATLQPELTDRETTLAVLRRHVETLAATGAYE
ncbi:TetR/AcrR family transcriptional regulator [Amycolatopsis cihanbeyliensis]|uniref:TetR family transcriptional regulator n=1 Tax=Amycolatopsis cihanbeyliensis TaxID=1128664 RepID=A0A542DCP7_AMYCI|nr:TetR family transcriptional regulator C-terminal domain-containing protein [Amycolatopsis cihanbeyliensis]TQJ00842.1 TetR family transcriptional regulator [Amycolatopsis cihanbeyliensis]